MKKVKKKHTYIPLWLQVLRPGVSYVRHGVVAGSQWPLPRPVTIHNENGVTVVTVHRRSPWAILKGWLR